MRARLAIATAGINVHLREIKLQAKPEAFLATSPSGTVPCLKNEDTVIDESLDIMKWALTQNDPDDWLNMPEEGWSWIDNCDGPFKSALDRTKYDTRYPSVDPLEQRKLASAFLSKLDEQLDDWIFDRPTIADFAILPFVRQFAFIDKNWFDNQSWPYLHVWLDTFLKSERFESIMTKYVPWAEGDIPIIFGDDNAIASTA